MIGTVRAVTLVNLGSVFVADTAAGVTVLPINDTSDFDPGGGTVSIAGTLYTYTAVDPDNELLSITPALAAAASVDDEVDLWDTANNVLSQELRAEVDVATNGIDDGDSISAKVSHALVPYLAEGIRDPGTGESVNLTEISGEWAVTNIEGKQPSMDGAYMRPNSIPKSSLGFTLQNGVQVTVSSVAPVGPNVNDIWINSDSANPQNNTMTQWDGANWNPVQFGTPSIAPLTITAQLIADGAIFNKIAAGELNAASINSLSLTSGTITGSIIGDRTANPNGPSTSTIVGSDMFLDSDDGRILVYAQTSTPQTLTGSGNYTVPASGVTSLKVECWGGGGGAQGGYTTTGGVSGFGMGGGGGEYARENAIAVTASQVIPFSCGFGGVGGAGKAGVTYAYQANPGAAGTATTFGSTLVKANGGSSGGSTGWGGSGSSNTVHYGGGNGYNQGGGGSSAGTSAAGNNGTGTVGGAAPAGGGKGGNPGTPAPSAGGNGTAPGGGGGAGYGSGSGGKGGDGGAGKIIVTYYASTLVASIAANAGVCPRTGVAYPAGIKIHRGDVIESPDPAGLIAMFGSSTPPVGWLLCNGGAVSRTTYARLFAVIGTTYGAGDGSTTFNVPNFASAFPRGNTPAANGGAASHSHPMTSGAAWAQMTTDVANKQLHLNVKSGVASYTTIRTITGSAEVVDSIAGTTGGIPIDGATDSTSTLPPYIGVNFIIKA